MKTPFDTILRIANREVVAMRSAVGVAAGRVATCEARQAAGLVTQRAEARLAAADWTLPTEAYFAAAALQRERLERDRAEATERLDAARRSAVEAYGSLRAVESAADRFREAEALQLRTAEQSAIDDFIGARYARSARRGRPPRSHPVGGSA